MSSFVFLLWHISFCLLTTSMKSNRHDHCNNRLDYQVRLKGRRYFWTDDNQSYQGCTRFSLQQQIISWFTCIMYSTCNEIFTKHMIIGLENLCYNNLRLRWQLFDSHNNWESLGDYNRLDYDNILDHHGLVRGNMQNVRPS